MNSTGSAAGPQARQLKGRPAVIGDHVGQSRGDVNTRTQRLAVEFGIGPVQVADNALGIE